MPRLAALLTLVAVLVTLPATPALAHGGGGVTDALGIGAAVLVTGVGLTHLPSLTSSQVATLLPLAFSRAVVALNLALIVPMAIVAWKGQEPWPEAAERPQPATAAPAT